MTTEQKTDRIASLRRQLMSYARMTHDDSSRKEWKELRAEYDQLVRT